MTIIVHVRQAILDAIVRMVRISKGVFFTQFRFLYICLIQGEKTKIYGAIRKNKHIENTFGPPTAEEVHRKVKRDERTDKPIFAGIVMPYNQGITQYYNSIVG